MALHGDISVNGSSIGHWGARRVRPLSATGVNTYRCEVTMHGQTVRIDLTHRYTDGPLALVTRLLKEATPLLPTVPLPGSAFRSPPPPVSKDT